MEDYFKKSSIHSKGGLRDTFFAISASLAIHIGVVLALITATAMSAGLKLWEDPVIHVSLISTRESTGSSISPDTPKKEYPRRADTHSVTESAKSIVSIDKQEENKIKEVPTTLRTAETQWVKLPAVAMIDLPGLEPKGKTKTISSNIGQGHPTADTSPPVSMAVPRYRDSMYPVYPWIARLKGYEGVVLLSAEIHADGKVGELKLKKSSGYAVLDRSALEAVKTWKFEPGKKTGTPIDMWVDVPVKFVLKDGSSAM